MVANPSVIEVDESSFERAVLQRSQETPVLVDFWAEWCAPCRALAPVLEGLVNEYGGAFTLAKVDTDQNQALANAFGIRSLPTVKLFHRGAVVEEFLGVQPESTIRALLERHIERGADGLRAEASRLVEEGELDEAISVLRQALASDPQNYRIHPDLAGLLIASGDYETAEATLDQLPADQKQEEAVKHCLARIEFARAASEGPSREALETALADDPSSCEARYRLAAHRVTAGDFDAALDLLIEVLRLNKNYDNGAARQRLISIFELLGPRNPLVSHYRGVMSSVLH